MRFCVPVSWHQGPIRVVLVGAGGTGSHVLDGLVAIHHSLVGLGHPGGLHVTVLDPDEVTATNVGRQRFLPGDEGHNKAVLLVHRANLCHGLGWTAVPRAVAVSGDLPDLTKNAELLVTCVDRASVRAGIGAWTQGIRRSRVLWLDTGNGTHTGQVVLGHLGRETGDEGVRLPHVFDLYPELAGMPDDGEPSCSMEAALRAQDLFVNRAVADAALSLLWALVRHGSLEHHGAYVDVRAGTARPLPIDPEVWGWMGYRA